MSHLHQLQVAYEPKQDRLLLTLRTQNFEEHRFWLTRRIIKPMWEVFLQLLARDQKTVDAQKHESALLAEKITQESQQRQPTAEKLSTPISRRPLGNDPLLIIQIVGKQLQTGMFILQLVDIQGTSVECQGDSTILLGLGQLIRQASLKAEWDLELSPLPS